MRRMFTKDELNNNFSVTKVYNLKLQKPNEVINLNKNGYYNINVKAGTSATLTFPSDYFILFSSANNIETNFKVINATHNALGVKGDNTTIDISDSNGIGFARFAIIGKLIIPTDLEY